ncbi:hypothetical protein [Umboniibacter marinipuniceus]|uniref:Uncharacterized protein n=1 Tax=Umboniibacter marinipuniceus TaxID=569599 RepID=A0A3L9ZZ89_9GAMM|nr:hypothetical protein [Umboniibacter marinipuniceus]RMA77667.1 hypothetical protein DFR27_2487 [Umboniibacter marinipuniceus]
MDNAAVTHFLRIIFWLGLPALGIAIAVAWNWATQSSLFKGQYGNEIAFACAAALLTLAVIALQRYILWAERRRLKRLLGASLRRSPIHQPDD